MLSDKLTFSLTSLLVLLVFGFVFVAMPAIAADKDKTADDAAGSWNVKLSVDLAHEDVSSYDDPNYDDVQIQKVADGATQITLLVTFDKVVQFNDTSADTDVADRPEGLFTIADIIVDAYDADGRALGVITAAEAADAFTVLPKNPSGNIPGELPGREYVITVDEDDLDTAYTARTGTGVAADTFSISTLLFSIPAGTVTEAGTDAVRDFRSGVHKHLHLNKVSNVLRIDLVDPDVGDARYSAYGLDTSVGVAGAAPGTPGVVSITRILGATGFAAPAIGAFDVRIILTEEPKEFTASHIIVENGTASDPVKGLSIRGNTGTDGARATNTADASGDLTKAYAGGGYAATDTLPDTTGRDNMYYQYTVTITPNDGIKNGEVLVSVGMFADMVLPRSKDYIPLSKAQRLSTALAGAPQTARNSRITNGREILRVPANTPDAAAKFTDSDKEVAANEKLLPHGIGDDGTIIPSHGYLVLTNKDNDGGVRASPAKTVDKKTTADKMYEFMKNFEFPYPGDNLDTFFRNGGTIVLTHRDIAANDNDAAHAAGDIIINEIMWGTDKGSADGQWIELKNTTDADITIEENEWRLSFHSGAAAAMTDTVIDSAGNPTLWGVPGQGGATSIDTTYPAIVDLISMSRVMDTKDAGTMAASWVESERPSANLTGRRIGTPGAANQYTPAPVPTPTPPPPAPMVDVATGADIRVSEIMVASNEGRLAQWIELANVSSGEVSLNGWGITIDNDPDDADVVGARVNVELGDVTVDAEQVVLVVSKSTTRTSGVGMDEGDIREDRIVDVQDQVSDEDRYSLISEMAFKISLIPPQTSGVVEPGDVVGNLGEGWELPMSEDGRSSLIRREMDAAAMAQMGTSAAGWKLASSTMLDGAYRTTYYGDDEDVGTPGYNAGGPLPVELSSFYPKRNEETGHVEITWKTQSELNNAGFFIKRSQQRDGKFVVVNPTMIPGAGTTSEEQSYAYTDTTAQPNVIYYYQIEDVSLDGQRQTLTLGTRLRGHIGAAGKATTTWGELKSQE